MRSDRTMVALVAAAAVAVYLPALAAGFNADDYLILWRIKTIERTADPLGYFKFAFYEYFRPLGFLSFALDWRLWHLDARGFHLTNITLHALNAALVFSMARRLAPPVPSVLAALLFALHPASHEVVYWVAARFDLLATFFCLVSLLALSRAGVAWQSIGIVSFALALLSKESAISLIVIAPAWDVFVARRDWRAAATRLIPLVLVVVLYSLARSAGADLDPAGGARKLPKALITMAAVAGVLFAAWMRDRRLSVPPRTWWVAVALLAAGGGTAALLRPEAASAWTAEKVAFLAAAWPHVLVFWILGVIFWSVSRKDQDRNDLSFALLFVAAALLPVSSMTGGLRYLYLPSVGAELVMAAVLARLAQTARRVSFAVVAVGLAFGAVRILDAGHAWRSASTMTSDGVKLMAASIERCGQDEVLLLTTPVAIGGVYFNLSWDAFDVLADCTPRSFMTLLRVVGSDIHVSVTPEAEGTIEIRAPGYTGNVVASEDLRNFTIPIEPGARLDIKTAAGRLQTFADGTTQVFRLEMTPEVRTAKRFYYSEGQIRR